MSKCVFCDTDGGDVLYRSDSFRIVWANEALYPGFLRLIWNSHQREFTDLSEPERAECFRAVTEMELACRAFFKPYKVNVASLGNVTPHLHWHVIPRFEDDAHFPDPVWSPARKSGQPTEVWNAQQRVIQENSAQLKGHLTEWFKAKLG